MRAVDPSTLPNPQAELTQWLREGAGGSEPCERVIETSISWVFLFRDRALKLKKPIDLGFLDFTSLAKRHWAALREVAFNRATAPSIYQGVRAITREDGSFAMDGAGVVADWVVEMRRFADKAVLSDNLGAIDGEFAESLGRRIAQFHLGAAVGSAGGGAAGLRFVLESNARQLRALRIDGVEAVVAETKRELGQVARLLDRRLANDFVRCCHGDLHLGNILLENGEAVLFDCIEFSDAMREIDVLYDLAFLLMDLDFRGLRPMANRVLNAWLDEAAHAFDGSAWKGLRALPLFQSVRAAVRAHVTAREGDIGRARRYLRAAHGYLAEFRPVLVAVGGLSGSGKTTYARSVAPALGGAPGAVILRSDEVRKRLWGRAPTQKLPQAAYTEEATAAVYAEVFAIASRCLAAGRAVVIDAVFLEAANARSPSKWRPKVALSSKAYGSRRRSKFSRTVWPGEAAMLRTRTSRCSTISWRAIQAR